ncbi:MAG: MFS transporter [Spirochaetales bacterium]
MNIVHMHCFDGRTTNVNETTAKGREAAQNSNAASDEFALSGDALPAKPKNLTIMLILYLLGIFMGAIDTGIVTPARTLIQSALGVDERTGIWMITIYTLAYAAIIPISGKLADRFGRKVIYLISIGLFGLGSLICSLSILTGQFWVLLAGRVVQALGGGGIMPIATAEFGTTFPPEKRGMALGLVGGVYGIANILGSTIGSGILGIFGTSRWDLLFLVNVPIALAIVVAGLFFLPNNKGEARTKIDWAGIPILSGMVLLLLYGLRNVDFFNLAASLGRANVYPFLIGFLVLLPLLILIERRSADPVLNLSYFTSRATLITLILGFAVGIMMMGMIFVPQFAENALSIATGSGGYFVAILGIFAGISAPLSGRLIDRFGPKKVLFWGFGITLAGALFLILVTIPQPSAFTVLASLAAIGLGLGFTMGTPLNYMMLQNTRPEESNSALATLSLVRSIGTAIAPAIMIGFLAHAGVSAQTNLMALLPPIEPPRLENAAKLQSQLDALKKDPRTAAMLARMDIPSFDMGSVMKFDMTGGGNLPPEIAAKLRNADVTTITNDIKALSSTMFELKTPPVIDKIKSGLEQGLTGIDRAIASMDTMARGPGAASIAAGRSRLAEVRSTMAAFRDEITPAFAAAQSDYLAKLESMSPQIEESFRSSLNAGFRQMYVTVAVASVLAALVLAFYRSNRRKQDNA